jgi:hypothetical protein
MKENRVCENIMSKYLFVQHAVGKINLADIFTKEMKDTTHFIELHDLFMQPRPST